MHHINSLMFTVKWLHSFLWKCQLISTAVLFCITVAKNKELTSNCFMSSSCFIRSASIIFENSRYKRKTHWVKECTTVCVCVFVCIYIDMVFRDNTVQAANMFSVTNAKYFKRNCEITLCFLIVNCTEFEEIGLNYFWKFENSNLTLISWLNAAFGNSDAK